MRMITVFKYFRKGGNPSLSADFLERCVVKDYLLIYLFSFNFIIESFRIYFLKSWRHHSAQHKQYLSCWLKLKSNFP